MEDATVSKIEPAYTQLVKWSRLPNIADELDDDEQGAISARVIDEYQIDKDSRADWETKVDKAIDLAKQVIEVKSYPWLNASNTKYPLLTVSSLQFAARAYPAIVNGGSLVKARVNGYDIDGTKASRATRIGKHMSFQLIQEMDDWEEDTDRLLTILPIAGMMYRKTYFDGQRKKNCSSLVGAKELVWSYHAKSFKACPRKTQEFLLYPYEIEERIRAGLYVDREYAIGDAGGDSDAPELFLEQHRLWDLDGDGLLEPYVITVHKESGKLARIVARFSQTDVGVDVTGKVISIKPVEYFTKYGFFPNPDGSAHDIGFCDLLLPMNESINTTLNMMLDAGHKQNAGGGMIGSGLRMKGGSLKYRIGEYIPVDVSGATIRDNLVDLPAPGPSVVLFQLLGFLVEAGRDISSVKDVLVGEGKQNEAASSVMARIEQGMQMFTSIYKRIHRAFGEELRKLYSLNSRYLPPQVYVTFLDSDKPTKILLQDYVEGDMDVLPASDDSVVTDMQKLFKAEALMQFSEDPECNSKEIKRRYFEALGLEDIDELFAPQQGPDPMQELALQEIMAKITQSRAAAVKSRADALLSIAKAESEEAGVQIEKYTTVMQALAQINEMESGNEQTGPGPVPGMEGIPGNAGIPGIPAGLAGAPQGVVG